jgi:hypothetical protein
MAITLSDASSPRAGRTAARPAEGRWRRALWAAVGLAIALTRFVRTPVAG